MKLQFLGTGGGRFATISQKRMTGGFRIDDIGGKNIHVDPGPGALVRSHQFGLNPRNSESVINGNGEIGPGISKYHQTKSDISVLHPGDVIKEDEITIRGTATHHGDSTCVGFNINYDGLNINYTADTEYFPELSKEHEGADVLIGCVIKEGERKIKGHMRTMDFEKLVEEVQPQIAIMTHLGVNLIMNNPFQNTRIITNNTGVRTVAATDGLTMSLDQFIRNV